MMCFSRCVGKIRFLGGVALLLTWASLGFAGSSPVDFLLHADPAVTNCEASLSLYPKLCRQCGLEQITLEETQKRYEAYLGELSKELSEGDRDLSDSEIFAYESYFVHAEKLWNKEDTQEFLLFVAELDSVLQGRDKNLHFKVMQRLFDQTFSHNP